MIWIVIARLQRMDNNQARAQIVDVARIRTLYASGQARRLRESAHLTLADVARATGVHRSTVLRWEQRATRPDRDQAVRVAALFDAIEKASA